MKEWSTLKKLIWLHMTPAGGASGQTATVKGFAPLTLLNAIAKKIRRLVQIGKCTVSGTDITCNNGVLKYDSELGIYADGTPEEIKVTASGADDQTATASNLFAVGNIADEQDIISGTITRRCEAVVSDGTTPSGRYIGTVGEGNIIVQTKETGYSGAIASFTADKAEPLSGLVAEINPVQDLHGYDAPWPAGGGKNLLNVNSQATGTLSGMVVTSDENYITVNGTKYGSSYNPILSMPITLPAGTYYVKSFNISGSKTEVASFDVRLNIDINTQLASVTFAQEQTFTLESETTFYINLVSSDNAVYTNYKFGVVISKTSGIDKFYPYANECPISGWTGLEGQRTGRNLLDVAHVNSGLVSATIGASIDDTTPSTRYAYSDPIFALNGLNISIKSNDTNKFNWACLLMYNNDILVDRTYVSPVSDTTPFTRQINANTFEKVIISFGAPFGYDIDTSVDGEVQVALGSTASTYEPYTGEAISVSWEDEAGTVYDGTLDVVSGDLFANVASVDCETAGFTLYNTEAGRWICDFVGIKRNSNGAVTAGLMAEDYREVTANAYNNIIGTMYLQNNSDRVHICTGSADIRPTGKLIYPLAEPIHYTLTPQQIETLVGQNNVFVDTGDVTAYVPDFTTEQVAGQSLSTTDGTNTVFVTSNVDPVELEVKYAGGEEP